MTANCQRSGAHWLTDPGATAPVLVRGMSHVALLINRRSALALGATGVLVVLAGCGPDATGGGASAAGTTAAADPAVVSLSVADGATDVSPATPLQATVVGGSITDVTVTDGAGTPVQGTLTEVPAAAPAAPAASSSSATSASSSSASASASAAPSSGSAAAGTTSVWTPAAPLAYGTSYTVTATAQNADGASSDASGSFTTVAPASVSTPSIGPLDGTTVGVGMPIRVFFDQPVTNKAEVERNLVVTSSTPTDGRWSWMSDTEVHFRPSTYWPANTQVTVDANLYGVDLGDGVWGEKNRTVSFTVGDKHVSVADAGSHTLTVYSGDQVVQTYPMSAGSNANPTRNGAHVVLEKFADITMDSSTFGLAVDAPGGYRTDVKYATRISNNGEFVHAAPWSVGQQGSSNVSHGCINLSTDRAQWFYDFSQPGDVVEVVNSIGPTLSRADGDIYDWAIPWDQWVAGSALS
ncbi:peptidoglycan transpeptidase precursor, ErfK-YbiS-YhnG family [Klenkia brasiliensis]|uniref:Peptidoglycan transpeptidase, ErfK-YbiS-YhnG family n=1 Tax=Klenkia brasiliensis TaxID=333142 RepID=A0A1G7UEY6_9ACTN|nr:peptidoglycan transpeptidase precursor, ErfK-YbiS-YhnG family [Klenkia brasiliensis]